MISLTLSTQVFEAASISIISDNELFWNQTQTLHSEQGFQFWRFWQFIVFANMLAVEVFQVHLGQQNKYDQTNLSIYDMIWYYTIN